MRKIKACIVIAIFVLCGFAATNTFAQEASFKTAYVNLSLIFDQYKKTKDYDALLEEVRSGYEKELNEKAEKIRDDRGKLALLKDDEKAKLQEKIDKAIADLEKFDQEKKTDLRKQRDEKIRDILLEIEKVISDYAKKEKYSFIFNDKVLVYADESLDITEPVLKILNEKYANQSK